MTTQQHMPNKRQPFGSGFFIWIRSWNMNRSSDRWLGGVSGAIAGKLGWDPIIIRIFWLALTLAWGTGLMLYGLLWLLLPDERNGAILLENVIDHGDCPADFWGALIVTLVGAPAFPVALIVLGAIAVAYFVTRDHTGTAQSAAPGATQPGAMPQQGMPQPGAMPAAQPGMSQPGAMPAAQPEMSQTGPMPQTAPMPQPGAMPQPGMPHSATYGATYTTAGGPAMQAPTFTAPQPTFGQSTAYAKAAKATARRKPAGPIIVSACTGAILIALGIVLAANLLPTGHPSESLTRMLGYWALGSTLFIGIVLIALGLNGRRSGGIGAIAVILVAISILTIGFHFTYVSPINGISSKTAALTTIGETRTYTSSQYEQLQRGVRTEYSDTTIDLSDWHTTHPTSSCPTGDIYVWSMFSTVRVVLPEGCDSASVMGNGPEDEFPPDSSGVTVGFAFARGDGTYSDATNDPEALYIDVTGIAGIDVTTA